MGRGISQAASRTADFTSLSDGVVRGMRLRTPVRRLYRERSITMRAPGRMPAMKRSSTLVCATIP